MNLNMVWKQANDSNHIDQSEAPGAPSTGSVIKKLGIPVSKLIGDQNTVSHRSDEKLDLQNYVNRMQPMQSILTIRPENGLPGHLNGVSGLHGNGHVPSEVPGEHQPASHRVKANSIESPPQLSNKSSEDELNVDSDGQTNGHGHNEHGHNGHTHNGEHSGNKDNGSVRTSVITENIDNIKVREGNYIGNMWSYGEIWGIMGKFGV